MKITDVRVRKITSENRMKAVASITFDEVFVVHDIKVIESDKGLFIAMPSKRTKTGDFKDIAHPINTETREDIQAAIIAKYHEVEAEPVENYSKPAEEVTEEVTDAVEEATEETSAE